MPIAIVDARRANKVSPTSSRESLDIEYICYKKDCPAELFQAKKGCEQTQLKFLSTIGDEPTKACEEKDADTTYSMLSWNSVEKSRDKSENQNDIFASYISLSAKSNIQGNACTDGSTISLQKHDRDYNKCLESAEGHNVVQSCEKVHNVEVVQKKKGVQSVHGSNVQNTGIGKTHKVFA